MIVLIESQGNYWKEKSKNYSIFIIWSLHASMLQRDLVFVIIWKLPVF
jgi:hypothetical protein